MPFGYYELLLPTALNLRYFYQICDSENPKEEAHTANLIVDCQILRKNIEQMLKKSQYKLSNNFSPDQSILVPQ
ncbi:MAG: hypothetical protein VKN72_25250 [Nostocales cyanobacterium 94392]|nr:hypothetical protein [Nostocales cyanobacterium 94392]